MFIWDFDARNHEVTDLRVKNVRLKENYGDGEILYGKTGSGPILLTASFPNVRDWLNLHPLQDVLDALLICDLNTGKPECYFHGNKHRRKAKSYPFDVFERRSLQC